MLCPVGVVDGVLVHVVLYHGWASPSPIARAPKMSNASMTIFFIPDSAAISTALHPDPLAREKSLVLILPPFLMSPPRHTPIYLQVPRARRVSSITLTDVVPRTDVLYTMYAPVIPCRRCAIWPVPRTWEGSLPRYDHTTWDDPCRLHCIRR